MSRTFLWLFPVGALLVGLLVLAGFPRDEESAGAGAAQAIRTGGDVVEPPWAGAPGVVFDINVHTREELELVLRRMEGLSQGAAEDRPERITLVLHGPEVAFFATRNYAEYRDLVDLAAKLSAFELVDIKMCKAQMQTLGIEAAEIPPFIELVPFGPAEVDRLRMETYVVM